MNEQQQYLEVIEGHFETFMEGFELDSEESLSEILFELFAAGFDAAVEDMDDEDDDA